MLKLLEDAPRELQDEVTEFFPEEQWDACASVSWLESNWDPFAVNDTTSPTQPCGTYLGTYDGMRSYAERSVGWFQINSCNYPQWEWQRFYNTRHNVGTAHMIWRFQGWGAWLRSAKALGLPLGIPSFR